MAALGVMVVGQPRYFWDAGDAWLAPSTRSAPTGCSRIAR